MPCRRSSSASAAVATASQSAPPVERGARAPDVAVPVRVGLDDRAQSRVPREQRLQVRAVALDRAEVDPRQRPLGCVTAIASGIASITSPAITWFAPSRPAATWPARACASTPAAAASNGSMPFASRAPVEPGEDVAGAGRRQRRRGAGADRRDPLGRADDRVVALQHDDAAAALRGLARARRAVPPAPRSDSIPSRRPSSPSCGVSTVGAGRSRSDSSRPACAFSPSASISTGTRRAPGDLARPFERAVACGRSRVPARAHPPARTARARGRRPPGTCAPSSSGMPWVIASSSFRSKRRLGRRRHRDLHVARAGAHRGERRHRRRAGQAARAAGDHHHAGLELRARARARRHQARARRRAIRPARAGRGRVARDPDLDHLDPARVLLAGIDVEADLRAVEGRGHVGPHGVRLDLAGRRVDARRGRRRRRRRRVGVVDRARSRPPPARAARPRSRCRASRRRSRPTPRARPARTGAAGRRAGGRGSRARRPSSPTGRPRRARPPRGPPRAAAAPRPARRRRCCPCRRRRGPGPRRATAAVDARQPDAGALHQVEPRDAPLARSPRRRRRASRRPRRGARASRAGSCGDRDRARRSCACASARRTHRGRRRAPRATPVSRTDGAPAGGHDLDVPERPARRGRAPSRRPPSRRSAPPDAAPAAPAPARRRARRR